MISLVPFVQVTAVITAAVLLSVYISGAIRYQRDESIRKRHSQSGLTISGKPISLEYNDRIVEEIILPDNWRQRWERKKYGEHLEITGNK